MRIERTGQMWMEISVMIRTSLRDRLVCPVIAPSLALRSQRHRGRGDIYSSVSHAPLTPPGEEALGWSPFKTTGSHTHRRTQSEPRRERRRKTLTCSFSSKTSMPKLGLQINAAFKKKGRDGLTLCLNTLFQPWFCR